jgi:CheY-like chemotaxis protein
MPGMDGFDVIKQLAANEPGNYLPVMVITAMPEHNLQALQSGGSVDPDSQYVGSSLAALCSSQERQGARVFGDA